VIASSHRQNAFKGHREKMEKTNDVTVILPTLNESGNIRTLIEQIRKSVPECSVIVVDDCSKDGTAEIVKSMISDGIQNLSVIERAGVPCLTDSIQLGIDSATTQIVCWMDADLSHPPAILPALIDRARISGCGVASRFIDGSKAKQTSGSPDSFAATVLSTILNILVKKWLQIKMTDFTSGFIACKREYLMNHRLVGDYGEYFIELMHYFTHSGIEIREVAFESPARTWGESKTGTSLWKLAKRGIKYLKLAFVLRFRSPRSAVPHSTSQRAKLFAN